MNSDKAGQGLLTRLARDYLGRHLPWLLVATVLMTIEGGALGALSYMVKPMFDSVFVAREAAALGTVAAVVFALFVARALAGFVQRMLVVTVGLRVVTDLQKDLLAHLLTLDTSFFQKNAPGGLIERVRGDAQSLQQAASSALMTLGRDSVSLLSLVAVMLWVDWFWTILAFVGLPLLVVPLHFLNRYIRRATGEARQNAANLSTRLDEIFHGITAIKLNWLFGHEKDRFGRDIAAFLRASTRAEAGKAALPALIDLIAAIGFLGVLLVGGREIVNGEKTVGDFMAFFTAMGLMFDPLRRLSSIGGTAQAAIATLERLYGLLDTRPTVLTDSGAKPRPHAGPGGVSFEDVVFRYGDAPVLNGLTFRAEPGETVALVGPSGAGKSTVFHLLARLADPAAGQIRITDQVIADMPLEDLRSHLSVVSQDASLFDDSIRNNIRLGRLGASDAEIDVAAERASVSAFARGLDGGLDAPAGPRGSNLSGGQRQRVAIARAFLRDTPILLLDEPTSALDAESEALVQKALQDLTGTRTTLVIAHRLATIRQADRILVMEAGRVVDQGSHEELIARGGLYARLHALQFRED